jgi:hypothetical protein
MQSFSYEEAFSRNIGWLTRQEQDSLRHKRVAIAWLSGVGHAYLRTLSRFGIGKYHLADFDRLDACSSKYPFPPSLLGFELAPRSRDPLAVVAWCNALRDQRSIAAFVFALVWLGHGAIPCRILQGIDDA